MNVSPKGVLSSIDAHMKTVWHYGMFDFDNYGDLLFPVLSKYRLEDKDWSYKAVSLSGQRTRFRDAVANISRKEAVEQMKVGDVILIGGGNIIHDQPLNFFENRSHPYSHLINGTDLWLGAIIDGLTSGCRVIFNAPGAFAPLRKETRHIWQQVMELVDYVSVRDQTTANILGVPDSAHIMPDPAIDQNLSRVLLQSSEWDQGVPGKLVVSIRRRSTNVHNLESICRLIREICARFDLEASLLPLSESHDDHQFMSELNQYDDHLSYNMHNNSLREIATSIRRASALLTSSLHAYITAIQVGTPVFLIKRPKYNKFDGFLRHLADPGRSFNDWHDLLAITNLSQLRSPNVEEAQRQVDSHWIKIKQLMEQPGLKPKTMSSILGSIDPACQDAAKRLFIGK
jgi:polysaccharide pyruvyl transferase WcaK-like protein